MIRADENYVDLGLWLVDTETWEHTPLAVPGYGSILGGAVSPDGRSLIYSCQKGMFNPSEVWMVNTDGQDARQLFTVEGTAGHFAWSPEGSKIVFLGDGLTVMDAEEKNLRTLELDVETGCFVRHYAPIWSPNSHYLAIAGDFSDLPFTDPWSPQVFRDTNICLIDVESGEARPLLPGQSSGATHPAWSPDGSQIAFVSNRGGGMNQIWVVNVDGNNLRQVTMSGLEIRFPFWRRP